MIPVPPMITTASVTQVTEIKNTRMINTQEILTVYIHTEHIFSYPFQEKSVFTKRCRDNHFFPKIMETIFHHQLLLT